MAKITKDEIIESGIFTEALRDAEAMSKVLTTLEKDIEGLLKSTKQKIKLFDPNELKAIKPLLDEMAKAGKLIDDLNGLTKKRLSLEQQIKELQNNDTYKNQVKDVAVLSEQKKQLNAQLKSEALNTAGLISPYQKLSGTLNQLRKEYKDLVAQNKHNTDAGKQMLMQIQQLDRELKQIDASVGQFQRNVGNYPSLFQQIGNQVPIIGQVNQAFNQIGETASRTGKMIIGAFAGLEIVKQFSSLFTGLLDSTARISDVQSDIQKTANVTKEEVFGITEALKELDTRTSIEELLKISAIGGQLGIEGKDGVIAFTTAIDKLSVALGDEFTGGAEQITKEVGTLSNVMFGATKDGTVLADNLLKVGNALNELGASGSATAPVIVDFATRISPLASKLGLTRGEILGISATLQELGVNAEAGGTATVSLLKAITGETDRFSKVLGINQEVLKKNGFEAKTFKELVEKDLAGAFSLTTKLVGEQSKTNVELSTTLKNLGIDGARETLIFAQLGNNQKLLADRTKIATDALTNQSSIIKEFEIKNNNFAGSLQKLKNGFAEAFQSQEMQEFLSSVINGISVLSKGFIGLIKVLVSFGKFVLNNAIAVGVFASGLLFLNTALIAQGKQMIINNFQLLKLGANYLITTARTTYLALQTALLTAWQTAAATSTGLLSTAMRFLNIVIASTPWGFLATALLTIGGALVAMASNTSKATKEMQLLADINEQVGKDTNEQIARSQVLIAVLNNQNASYVERKKALDELQKISPEYFKNLSLEKNAIDANKKALDDYILNLRKVARQKAIQAKFDQNQKAILDVQTAKQEESVGFGDKVEAFIEELASGQSTTYQKSLQKSAIKNKAEEIASLLEEQKLLEKLMREEGISMVTNTTTTTDTVNSIQDKSNKKQISATKSHGDEMKALLKRIYAERRKQLELEINNEEKLLIARYYEELKELETQFSKKARQSEKYKQLLLLIETNYATELEKIRQKERDRIAEQQVQLNLSDRASSISEYDTLIKSEIDYQNELGKSYKSQTDNLEDLIRAKYNLIKLNVIENAQGKIDKLSIAPAGETKQQEQIRNNDLLIARQELENELKKIDENMANDTKDATDKVQKNQENYYNRAKEAQKKYFDEVYTAELEQIDREIELEKKKNGGNIEELKYLYARRRTLEREALQREYEARKLAIMNDTTLNDEARQKELEALEVYYNRRLALINNQAQDQNSDTQLAKQKQLYDNLNSIADAFAEREQARLQRKIDLIDKEIQASKDRQSQLTELAKQGIEDATNNLAFEQRKQAELEIKREKQIQRQKYVELGLNALKTYTTKLENKDKTPLASTLKDITLLTAFIRSLPTFYSGIENTGNGGNVDNKGGFLSVLHPNERVLTAEQNTKIGGFDNETVASVMEMYRFNLLRPIAPTKQNTNNLDPSVLVTAIQEAFKGIEVPTQEIQYHKLLRIFEEQTKTKTKTTIKKRRF